MASDQLVVESDGGVLRVTINRPEKKNAMNPVMVNELAYGLSYAHHNSSIWVVVIDAKGDVFSAGADLKAFAGMSQEEHSSTIPEPKGEVIIAELFTQVHKPCIAKVHAPVLAGAFLIICGCTHVVSADTATFSLPEVKRGLWPMQVMQSLIEILPARTALDLCMRGTKLSCAEAHELGLVTAMVPFSNLDASVNVLVDEIKSNSPSAIRHGLKAYDELRSIADNEKQAYLKKMLFAVLGTADAKEGITAFKEKRSPKWTGI
mgnify:CR=1 FL=1